MNNIQVPDPGLLFKLEHLLNVRIGEDENVYLDVRIVCSDGELTQQLIVGRDQGKGGL